MDCTTLSCDDPLRVVRVDFEFLGYPFPTRSHSILALFGYRYRHRAQAKSSCAVSVLAAMAMIPMEYKLVSKNSNVGKVFAANGPRWRRCGPEGNQRMVRCWLNGGPPGTTFYLTVAAMVAYKLELVKIDHAGMVFRRCSGKMPDYRFVVRPCGLLRPLSVDLARSGTSIHCSVTALSADLVLDKLYLDQLSFHGILTIIATLSEQSC